MMAKIVTMSYLSHYQHSTTALTICLSRSFRDLTVAWATRCHSFRLTTQVTTPGFKADRGYGFPLPALKMATRTSPPLEPHASCSASAPSGLTGLLQVTVGTLKDGIPGFGVNALLSALKDLIPRHTMSYHHLSYNTARLRPAAEGFRMPDTRAFVSLHWWVHTKGRACTFIGLLSTSVSGRRRRGGVFTWLLGFLCCQSK